MHKLLNFRSLIRIIAKETGVRGLACVTTHLANEAAERHGTTRTTTAVLERALTSGILTGALLKVGQRVAVKFAGNGPAGKAIVEADAYGRIRGYLVNPEVDLPLVDGKPNIVDALGELGLLSVVKDLKLQELAVCSFKRCRLTTSVSSGSLSNGCKS